jgi:hypothetical protein
MSLAQIVMSVEMDDAELLAGAHRLDDAAQIWEGDRMIAADHHRHNALRDEHSHRLSDALEGALHVGQNDPYVTNISGAERGHGAAVAARIGGEIHQPLAHRVGPMA